MMTTLEGDKKIKGKKFCVVAARFNEYITKNLLAGCLAQLKACGVNERDVWVVWVPGAFEIPVVALKMAQKKKIAAVICLGAIIRGETHHFDLVARGAAEGISRVALETEKPVIFEVLVTNTLQQAYKRSEIKGNNKGQDAALSAVKMVSLLTKLAKV